MPHARRSQPPPPPESDPASTQDKIHHAALDEFAECGFAGARVDHIAAMAGVNKAMLYYHFGNKQQLYRAVLQRLFTRLGDELDRIAARPTSPGERLETFIATFTRLGLAEPRMAPIMVREIAEGAGHLDPDTVRLLIRLPMTLGTITEEGVKAGAMRAINPVLAYLSIVWPIMIYLVSERARDTIRRHARVDLSDLEPDAFIRHMQDMTARMFDPRPEPRRRQSRTRHTEHAS
jgi:AcrR family transcriptional regulator